MMYLEATKDFNPRFEVVSCFIEYDGKIVILRRHERKSYGGKWGLPAGKVKDGEDLPTAVVREIKEETGLSIPKDKAKYLGKTFHRHKDYDFVYHNFLTKIDALPKVTINPNEHTEFAWKTPREIITMQDENVEDFDDICKIFYKI